MASSYNAYRQNTQNLSFSASFQYAASAVYTSELAAYTGARTAQINTAFSQLKNSVIQRGVQYAGNTPASRGGFMAENFVAESHNLDAVLKNIDTPAATVPGETGRASADIVFGDGKASLKFYKDAESSGKAQLNPEYENQYRIVPADQLEDARTVINEIADRNELKGRIDAAKSQREVADKLTDRIRSENGTESTPLTKQQDMKMANAIRKEADGTVIVDEKKIDQVMEETGISKKVHTTKLRNELKGLGMAAAIGLGMGFTMSLIAGLARVGLDSGKIDDAIFDSLTAGMESGAVAAVTYTAGRGAAYLMEVAGVDLLSASGYMMNFTAVGLLSTSIICAYQFTKSKLGGASTDEAFSLVGRTVLPSTALLAVSLAAQGIWGGPAGIIVSTGTGLALLVTDTAKTISAKRLENRIRAYAVEECKNIIDNKKLLYSMN